jgi:autotransporter-associated beta strand protein
MKTPMKKTTLKLLAAAVLAFAPAANAQTLQTYYNFTTYGTQSGGASLADLTGNTVGTLTTDSHNSLTSSGLTIASGGTAPNTGVQIGSSYMSGFTGSFSIQMWVTLSALTGNQVLFGANNNGSVTGNHVASGPSGSYIGSTLFGSLRGTGNAISGYYGGSSPSYNQYGTGIADGSFTSATATLYDVVLTYDGTYFREYINGVLKGTSTATSTFGSLATASSLDTTTGKGGFSIGGGMNENFNDNSLPETTSDFLLYNGALSQAQITALHTLGVGASLSSVKAALPNSVWNGGGGDNNWTTGLNWVSGNQPNAGDALTFAGSTQTTANMNASYSVGSLTFSNSAASFTITNSANTLTLGGGLVNNSANAQTINVPVTMSTIWPITAAAGNLTLTNVNNNGNPITFAGSANSTVSGAVSGSGALNATGSGVVTLSGVNTYTGASSVNAGILTVSGSLVGTASNAGQINVGQSGNTANATLNIQSGAIITQNGSGNILIGNGTSTANGIGAVYQSGGTVSGINQLQLGATSGGSYGYYNLSSGTVGLKELDLSGGTGFGGVAHGVLDISGGTMTVANWFVPARGTGAGISIINMTGGTLNFNGGGGEFSANWNTGGSTFVLNLANASLLSANTTSLNLMRAAGSANLGEINLLSGGLLQANSLAPSTATGNSLVNFNGGTLKANAATATFITTLNTAVNVYGGGGMIDNNGIAITIPKALLAPAGNGINGTVTFTAGSGYVGAPAVTFSGGSGVGAAGYATISGGAVNGIVVTCPGTGYTSVPTVTLTGGGYTSAATATAPTPTANTSGGMTFQGSSTNTLTAANTYTGDTAITGGTLTLGTGGSLSSANIIVSSGKVFDVSAITYTMAASQALRGLGNVNGSVTLNNSTSYIKPGTSASVGTITFNNNLTMTSGGATFRLSTSAGSGNDQAVVTQNLTIGNSDTIHISALSGAANLDSSGADYVLFSVSGTTTMATTPGWAWDGTQPANYLNYSIQKVGQNVVLHYTSASAPRVVATSTPATVVRGQAITVTATVTPGSPGSVTNVQINASAIGGSSTATLVLSGTPNVYTNTFTVASGTAPGVVTMPVVAIDTTPLTSPAYNVSNTIVATNEVWTGGGSDNLWSTSPNWNTAAPALSGDAVTFAGTTSLTPNMNNSYSVTSLTFGSTAGSFTITNSSNTLTLTGGVTNNSANAQTINVPVSMSTALPITAAAGNLTFGQNVTNNGNTVTFAGSANATVSGVISGSGALTASGSGAVTLSGANTYTGATTVSGGTLALTGSGAIPSTSQPLLIGTVAGTPAAVYQSGASTAVSVAGASQLGSVAGASGYYNLSAGTLTIQNGGELDPAGTSGGAGTFGQFDMSGGSTVNVGTSGTGSTYFLPCRAGVAGESSVVNLSGGTFTIFNGMTDGTYPGYGANWSGGGQTNVTTISGSALFQSLSESVKLNWANNAGNTGILNLDGGTCQMLGLNNAQNLNVRVNFDGGTVKAGNSANANFLGNSASASVYVGGGTVDNNGKAITITQPIVASAGNGIATIPVSGGAGYVIPPLVFISDTTGSNATAYAQIGGGTVTNIVVTCPGNNYSSTPTVTLVGGGYTSAATIGTVTTAANTSGGMTFADSGAAATTTLSGANTYTGNTTISAGTLALSGSGSLASSNLMVNGGATFNVSAISYTVAANQALRGFGNVNGNVTLNNATSIIQPGTSASVGTNTFINNLTMTSGGATFRLTTSASGSGNDQTIVTGNLTLNASSTIHISALSGATDMDTSDYVLFAVTGTTTMSTTPVLAWDGTKPGNYRHYTIATSGNNVVLHYLTALPIALTSATATPSALTQNQGTTITATVDPGSGGNITVTADLTQIGGSSTAGLVLSGTPYVYTNTFYVSAGTTAGSKTILVTAADDTSSSASLNISPVVVTNVGGEVWNGGGGGNWSDNADWVSGFAPSLAGDSVTFDGNSQTSPNMDNSYSVAGVTFAGTAASFTLTTANSSTLTLTGTGVTNNSANAQTLNVPIVMSAAQTFNAAAGNLTLANGITNGGNAVTVIGAANTVLSGSVSGSGNFTMNGSGTLTVSGSIVSSGTVNFNNGTSVVSGVVSPGTAEVWVSDTSGNGTLNVPTGGTLVSSNWLVMGRTGTTGTMNVNGGAVVHAGTGNISLGTLGTTPSGTINLNGGSISNLVGETYLGEGSSTRDFGFYNQAGGIANLGNFYVGHGTTSGMGIGTATVTGGTLTVGNLEIGYANNSTQTGTNVMTIGTGATVNAIGFARLAFAGSSSLLGILTNSGTLNVGATALYLSYWPDGCSGHIVQNSGAINLQNNASIIFGLNGAQVSVNDFVQNGGTVTFYSDTGVNVGGTGSLNLGNSGSGNNTYTLAGGTLTVPQIQRVAGTATFNFNGGTLKAAASSPTFLQGLTAANVQSGGANIDTASYAITVGQALLNGGGNGGLTKTGNGTLKLSSAETYTGNTVINAGTLALSGSGAIANSPNIILAGNAWFDVSGLSSYALVSGQTLTNISGTGNLAGNVNLSAGSLALSYTNGTPSLSVTNGTLTFNGNAVTVAVAGSLPHGIYKLISTNSGGLVSGTLPATVTVNGIGTATGSLSISNGELYLTVNHAPVAGNATYTRNAGIYALRITISDLLTNVTDADSDTITLVGTGTSTNGVIVSLSGTNLLNYYNMNNVNDQFSYTVTDGFGGTNTGLVSIVVSNAIVGPTGGAITSFTAGVANLTFHGIPNYSYIAERSTNLSLNVWVDIATNTAATNGVISVTDSFGDLGGAPASAYYRLKWQP